jgi:hypothetical protein
MINKFLTIVFIWIASMEILFGQPVDQNFTSGTGTYTIPAGYITNLTIRVWGGGGGITGGAAARSGGGGGGYTQKTIEVNSVSGPIVFNATVGSGVPVGTAASGGTSTVTNAALGVNLTATGGGLSTAGAGGVGGTATGGDINSVGGTGGVKGAGAAPVAGGGGGAAGSSSGAGSVGGSGTGNTNAGIGGIGVSGAGSGGDGSLGSATAGAGGAATSGSIPGGGAGAKGDNGTNGAGARGEIQFDVISVSLPITLTEFKVLNNNKSINIIWQTASEINNDYFSIERSSDGKNFNVLDIVKGNGNSNKINHYSTIDENPLPGLNYYRLKQTDYDGTFTFSEVKSVNVARDQKSSIRTIASSNRIRLESETDKNIITIYDMMGRPVKKFENLNESQDLSLDDLKGNFIAVLTHEGRILQTLKMILVNP